MSLRTYCGGCGRALNEAADVDVSDRQPCRACGSSGRYFTKEISATVSMAAYLVGRHKRTDADRSLPAKGIVRFEAGRRVGRDGRLVEREARYDPYADLAKERVVDTETNEIIVDKSESMKEKYRARGRWRADAES